MKGEKRDIICHRSNAELKKIITEYGQIHPNNKPERDTRTQNDTFP